MKNKVATFEEMPRIAIRVDSEETITTVDIVLAASKDRHLVPRFLGLWR